MSVEQLFKFETANFIYRHFNNLLPSVFGHTFGQTILKSNKYHYCTRKTRKFSLNKLSVKYKRSLMWNKTPNSIKNTILIKEFHKVLPVSSSHGDFITMDTSLKKNLFGRKII